MLRVRTTKTGKGKLSVHVCLSKSKKVVVIQHIGTVSKTKSLDGLKKLALNYIATQTKFPLLSPSFLVSTKNENDFLLHTSNLEIVGTTHLFSYDFLEAWYKENGFLNLESSILKDLVISRILEPSSKLQTIDF